jgi:flavin reductase
VSVPATPGVAEGRLERRAFTSREFRDTMGGFATGVNVITTRSGEHRYGMTATAFSSVSLDPPLILVCIGRTSEGSEVIARNGVFAVNILSKDQEPLSRFFASKDRPRGVNAFQGVDHHEAVTGSPLLDGAAGYVDCRLATTHDAGDHLLFVGEVLALGVDPEVEPLVFHGGRYAFLRSA